MVRQSHSSDDIHQHLTANYCAAQATTSHSTSTIFNTGELKQTNTNTFTEFTYAKAILYLTASNVICVIAE
jgi:hypothetical protein